MTLSTHLFVDLDTVASPIPQVACRLRTVSDRKRIGHEKHTQEWEAAACDEDCTDEADMQNKLWGKEDDEDEAVDETDRPEYHGRRMRSCRLGGLKRSDLRGKLRRERAKDPVGC